MFWDQYYTHYHFLSVPGVILWFIAMSFVMALSLLALAVYFLPSIIAHRRRHRNRWAIYALNFFLGSTGLGWVLSLVWSLTHNVEGRVP